MHIYHSENHKQYEDNNKNVTGLFVQMVYEKVTSYRQQELQKHERIKYSSVCDLRSVIDRMDKGQVDFEV